MELIFQQVHVTNFYKSGVKLIDIVGMLSVFLVLLMFLQGLFVDV